MNKEDEHDYWYRKGINVSQVTITTCYPVADPGFPVARDVDPLGGAGPPMWALFGENVCENERIGSRRQWRAPGTPP